MKFLKGNEEGEMEEGEKEGERQFSVCYPYPKGRRNVDACFVVKLPGTVCASPVGEDSQSLNVLTPSASPSSVHFSSNSDWVP